MSNYRQKKYALKQQNRINRLLQQAAKSRTQGHAAGQTAEKMVAATAGTPILIGHHSEGYHRRYLQRSDNLMRKAVTLCKRADTLEAKAKAAQFNTAISSDDPAAIERLEAKLIEAQAKHAKRKEDNAEARAAGTLAPYTSYDLSRTSTRIREIQTRITNLRGRQETTTTTEHLHDCTIVQNIPDNRTQIFFPGKPTERTRTHLKKRGFRWSPSVGCWQRHLSTDALHIARVIVALSIESE